MHALLRGSRAQLAHACAADDQLSSMRGKHTLALLHPAVGSITAPNNVPSNSHQLHQLPVYVMTFASLSVTLCSAGLLEERK